jgi:serine/threonine-protein kinase
VLHCDVKPGNILIAHEPSADGQLPVKLADFGLALLLQADDDLTRTGQLLGTPRYMAPEQAVGGRSQLSPRTDVWALGVVLYELLTGQAPFDGEGPAVLHAVQFAEPAPPRSRCRGVSRDLDAVCLKCLEKKAADRYASAADLAEDLTRVLKSVPTKARPLPRWRKAAR